MIRNNLKFFGYVIEWFNIVEDYKFLRTVGGIYLHYTLHFLKLFYAL